MKAIQKVSKSLMKFGVRATIIKIYIYITDIYFDMQHGTATGTWTNLEDLTIKSDNKERGYNYVGTRVIPLTKLFGNIKSMIPEDGIFVDFGCGKGRTLLIASQFGFREAIGVDFAQELCEIAINNCNAYKAKTAVSTEFQIIESDVVDYQINKNQNVFFMYNPFDEVVLNKILNNITLSLKNHYRKTLIIYCNPRYGNFIEQLDAFVKTGDFVILGINFKVYSSEV